MTEHRWSRVRRFGYWRWRCRRCGRLYRIRSWRPCGQWQLPLVEEVLA